jgi:hypothetical protein
MRSFTPGTILIALSLIAGLLAACTPSAPTLPGAPTSVTATPGDSLATVAFTPGPDGGSPITAFEYALDDGPWTAFDPPTATSPATVTGLVNGTTYDLRVRGVNAVGAGPASTAVAVTPIVASYLASAGGAGFDGGYAVSVYDNGSAVVAGQFAATAVFGTSTLVSAGAGDIVVARLDPNGAWVWASAAGGPTTDIVEGVAALADGGAIVTGWFTGTAAFGDDIVLTSTGLDEIFVARIDATGAWVWATSAGGMSNDAGYSVAATADGGAYVAGYYGSAAQFGTATLTSGGGVDAFVARIGGGGAWLWATGAGGASYAAASGVSVLPGGGAIVTGSFQGTAAFGDATLVSAGTYDIFAARIDGAGVWTWARGGGGPQSDFAWSVATFADDSAIVGGHFRSEMTLGDLSVAGVAFDDAFAARIDGDGTWLWLATAAGAESETIRGVSARPDGGAVVTGYFAGSLDFAGTPLVSVGGNDVFVASMGAGGTWEWAASGGGLATDVGAAVATLSSGASIVTGYLLGDATLGGHDHVSAGDYDLFVAKIDPDGGW